MIAGARRRVGAWINRSLLAAVVILAATAASAQATLAGWGSNFQGELGGGYKSPPQDPIAALGPANVKQIAASGHFSMALLGDGTVRAWGGNVYGQLGNGTREGSLRPVVVQGLRNVVQIAVSGGHAMALLSNGTVMTWGGNAWGELGNGTSGEGREGAGSRVPLAVTGLTGADH